MQEYVSLGSLLGTVSLIAALQFLVSLWLSERFKAQLQKENALLLESMRWDMRVREQAAKVAEYMALARDLRCDADTETFKRVNQLAWELALWLPADIYKTLAVAVTSPSEQINPLSVISSVRKILLEGKHGELTPDEILNHAPGIGNFRQIQAPNPSFQRTASGGR